MAEQPPVSLRSFPCKGFNSALQLTQGTSRLSSPTCTLLRSGTARWLTRDLTPLLTPLGAAVML